MRPMHINRSVASIAAALLMAATSGCGILGSDDSDSGSTLSSRIPRNASVVADGTGDLSWTATGDGQIYVQSRDREQVMASNRIRRGERVRVQPSDDRVRINDETIAKPDLKSGEEHRIYFASEQSRDSQSRDRDQSSSGGTGGNGVPSGAALMGRGKNEEILFTATRDGRVYLYNDDAQRVVSTANIRSGQRFTFSPGRSRATVDGNTAIDDRDINTSTNYSVYFVRD